MFTQKKNRKNSTTLGRVHRVHVKAFYLLDMSKAKKKPDGLKKCTQESESRRQKRRKERESLESLEKDKVLIKNLIRVSSSSRSHHQRRRQRAASATGMMMVIFWSRESSQNECYTFSSCCKLKFKEK